MESPSLQEQGRTTSLQISNCLVAYFISTFETFLKSTCILGTTEMFFFFLNLQKIPPPHFFFCSTRKKIILFFIKQSMECHRCLGYGDWVMENWKLNLCRPRRAVDTGIFVVGKRFTSWNKSLHAIIIIFWQNILKINMISRYLLFNKCMLPV